jgi:DNA topoisomerase-1
VRDGKYGPYVNHEKTNATLPKGKDPQSVTLEEAMALIAERIAKTGGGKKPARSKASAAKKAPAKKAAAKKPAAKKPAKEKA